MYKNNEPAPYGLYIGKPLDLTFVSAHGELIEGRENSVYRRVPTWLAFLLSPIMGGVFVLAFPALVLAAIAYAAGYWVSKVIRAFSKKHANLAIARFRPGVAYLTGSKDEQATERHSGRSSKEEDTDLQA